MTAQIPFSPYTSTNAAGSFNVSSSGFIQGMAMPDPASRFYLSGGVLASTETKPMWGGVGISEAVPGVTGQQSRTLGGNITRATTLTAASANCLTGFAVFDQNHAAVNSPSSPVPQVASGGLVNFYRLGSKARIAVACDPALASLAGSVINTQVSWDFVNQLLVPYIGTLTIASGTYSNTTGLVTLTMSAPVTFSAGDAIIVSGLTGTGAYASLNGTFTALSAAGTTVTYNPGASLGASTITGGSLALGSGASSALSVEVIDFNIGNSMTVSYNSVTGAATWNRSGSCALIYLN